MDIFKIIHNLREEKKRIDKAIAALEELATGVPAEQHTPGIEPPKKRRGRPRKHPLTS